MGDNGIQAEGQLIEALATDRTVPFKHGGYNLAYPVADLGTMVWGNNKLGSCQGLPHLLSPFQVR